MVVIPSTTAGPRILGLFIALYFFEATVASVFIIISLQNDVFKMDR